MSEYEPFEYPRQYEAVSGRRILKNGREFIKILHIGETSPHEADNMAYRIAYLLNAQITEERRTAQERAGVLPLLDTGDTSRILKGSRGNF